MSANLKEFRMIESYELAGLYNISASLDRHEHWRCQFTVEVGMDHDITLELRPRTVRLTVTSVPFNVRITLDDMDYGTTPTTISDLLIGDYILSLSQEGYGAVSEKVTIAEDHTTEVSTTLPEEMEVTITSTPAGSDLSINDVFLGKTPFTGELVIKSII